MGQAGSLACGFCLAAQDRQRAVTSLTLLLILARQVKTLALCCALSAETSCQAAKAE